jgi:lipopolysaccharide export system protein LptA
MSPNKFTAYALLTLFLGSFSATLLALDSDREQPIHISSDTAERNDKEGITTYTGAVLMDQGTLHIEADKVVIHTNANNDITLVVATGVPAEYRQKPAPDKEIVIAKGNTIEYMLDTEKLHIVENASLRQGDGTTLTGKVINYYIKTSVVKAEGGTSTREPGRIHMTIPPKSERTEASSGAN